MEQLRLDLVDADGAAITDREVPHREGVALRLAAAGHQHVGGLEQLGLADLVAQLFVAVVDLNAKALGAEAGRDGMAVVHLLIADRHDDGLHRGEPGGEGAGDMLDEDADEPLKAAEDGTMDDDGRLLRVLAIGVGELEPAGQLEVELDGGALPLSAERIDDVEVDLGAVEGAVAVIDDEGDVVGVERPLERGLGLVPECRLAHEVGGTGGELHAELQVEEGVDALDHADDVRDLLLDLLLGHKEVGIVLRELAHAEQAVEGAREFVAVQDLAFGYAQRKVAIAVLARLEEEHRVGAVHRLDAEDLALRLHLEHVLVVVLPVAGSLVERLVVDDGVADLDVALCGVDVAPEVAEAAVDLPAARVPEDGAGRLLMEGEEVKLFAELAVVATLGLLEELEVARKVGLVLPGGAVDALQHGLVRVAAPVGARHAHELEGLALAGAAHVGAAAEVDEAVLLVEADLGDAEVLDELNLVLLVALLEVGDGLLRRNVPGLELEVALHDALHARLDVDEVVGRQRAGQVEVVVEAVGDRRADGHAGLGEDLEHRLRHDVGAGVANLPELVAAGRAVCGRDLLGGLGGGLDRGRIVRHGGSKGWRRVLH